MDLSVLVKFHISDLSVIGLVQDSAVSSAQKYFYDDFIKYNSYIVVHLLFVLNAWIWTTGLILKIQYVFL